MCYSATIKSYQEGRRSNLSVGSLLCFPPFNTGAVLFDPPGSGESGHWWGCALYMSYNPRKSNGTLRRKYRGRFKAMDAPCGICRGRLGPIDYTAPSDSAHPLSFVIDEIRPVSRWREFGYDSPEAAAQDWNNLQAAHYCCNQAKSNHVPGDRRGGGAFKRPPSLPDGEW